MGTNRHCHAVTGFLLLTILLAGFTPVLAAEFTADLVLVRPGDTAAAKLYVKGMTYRVENLEGEEKFLAIENRATDTTLALNPETKEYKVMDGAAGAFVNPLKGLALTMDQMEGTAAGTETINGYDCTKTLYRYPNDTTVILEVWNSAKLDFVVKSVMHFGADYGDGLTELRNIVEGTVDETLLQVPTDYTRLKTPEEIEAALPSITGKATGESPLARRVSAGGELRISVTPGNSYRAKVENRSKDGSECTITPFKGSQPVADYVQSYAMSYVGERQESLIGVQVEADEIVIRVDKGQVIAEAILEPSSFSDDKSAEYFLLGRGRGLTADPDRQLKITVVGDSQYGSESKCRLHVYNQTYVDGMEQKETIEDVEFVLANGESKSWDYPPGQGLNYVMIEVDANGGVKFFMTQPK